MKFALLIIAMAMSLQAQWVNGFFVGNNGTLSIPNIPWSKYTAISHFAAYAGVNGSNIGNGTVNMSNIPDTAALIAARPTGKKVLLVLKDNDSFHSAFGQSAAAGTRSTFVTNITNAVVSNGYDGLELDWESTVNTSDYIALIAALRAAMPSKIIAIDVGDFSGLQTVANGAQANLDEVNVMCYDMDGASFPNNGECAGANCTWFNDSVFQAGDVYKNTCAQRTGVITGAGVVAAKIGIGIPYYGRRWAGATAPQTLGSFTTSTFFYRDLVTDTTRWKLENQQYDNVHKGQYLGIASLNEFDAYTGVQQIADIVAWAKSQSFGGYFSFVLDYEYLASASGDARYPLSTVLNSDVFPSPCSIDANGWCVTGLSAIQNNLLGPLIPYGASPWTYGDLANKGTADYMAPQALSSPPTLGAALPGTVSFAGGNVVTTTSDLRTPLSGQAWVVFAWNSIDGAGTGRAQCPIASVSATQITCSENLFNPSFSGITAYLMPGPDANGCTFTCWTVESPTSAWNYYDVAIGLYRLYYRTGNATYLTQAQQYADIQWQWVIDHGYRPISPRAASMISQFFRAGESHSERLPGLYNLISILVPGWATNGDLREAGYTLWDVALGAKVDTNGTRHAQYCSWLSTYTASPWIANQNSDGSWSENEFALNTSFISAPKNFTAPFQYQGAPWREAINIKSLEAAYESLNDTSGQGCNNPSLASTTLGSIAKAVTWQNNFGRDSSNRGDYYEVNSQSNDQASVSPATGTVSVSLSSTGVLGSGTTWQTAGYCDGTHFIGFFTPRTVYKIASCADNTHATLTVAFGLYGEVSNVSGSQFGIAPAASTSCNSSATYCYTGTGDRNLTRTNCGGIGWLYATTLNVTYKSWGDECYSATLGGPTTGLTSAANLGSVTLPCSGPACDGLVTDTVAPARNCNNAGTPAACLFGTAFGNLGKNYGEAWGAPGIDNELAWRLLTGPPPPIPPIITSTSPLPGGTVGTFYSFQFTASGTTPISWTAGVGKPAWATLSSSGALQGTPNVSGVSSIPITVTNAAGSDGPHNFSLTIVNSGVAPTITSTNPLPAGTIGVAYSFQFAAGGTAPITWTATGLPAWATLSSSGLFTGTPNAIGVSTMLVTATNTYGAPSKTFNLTISGVAPTITSTSPLPGGTNGTAYSFQFTASGTSPITWGATGLPAWASFSVGGLLTGTPNVSTTTTIAVTATNSTGTSGPQNFNLTVVTAPVAPTITTTSPLPNGTLGAAYSFQFAASGSATITWSGTGLPAWASLSSAGILTGTPNAIGVSTLHITATNGTGSDGPDDFTLTVPGVVPTVTSATPLPGGTIGIAYSFQFTATGTTPITWSATGLPGWASLSSGGLLTGTPNAAATTSFPVTATNATGSGGKTFSLTTINPATPPTITSTSPLPFGSAGIPYSYQFTANGTNPIIWSGTSLPPWAILTAGGFFSGTPTGGTTVMNITATNTTGSAGPTPFSITIAGAAPMPTCAPRTGLTPPNVLDIQYQTNMALGIISCTNNITESGTCNATDVQRVINAALGGACVIGP